MVAKQTKENILEFYLVNDLDHALEAVEATIIINGKSYHYTLDVARDSLRKFALSRVSTGMDIKLILKDKEGKEITSNNYKFSAIKTTKELR